ncbi:class I SAM-dependent methyltransferase [Acinetobacter puyangensis]|uniref:class I SAM-dependent methyltransferase n=1 Tax=Acinetobacter puyangensis TaxID=1096779 RepID=UPI003A4DD46E
MQDKLAYFDRLYHENTDPWGYAQRWYEQRKRQICLAVLLKPMYQHILEIGCSNGFFSQYLAAHGQQLTCVDANTTAIQLASNRLKLFKHVQVLQKQMPEQYPTQPFDLIVLSEMAYYLTESELILLIKKIQNSMQQTQGTLLCCHWRHPISGFELNGDRVHELIHQHLEIPHYLSLNDPDFLVDIWTYEQNSLAQQEELI